MTVKRPRNPRGHTPLDLDEAATDPTLTERKRSGVVASRRTGPKGEGRPHGD